MAMVAHAFGSPDVAEAQRRDRALCPDVEGGDGDPERCGGELLPPEVQAGLDSFPGPCLYR
jgi:hypothetical protein